MMLELRNVTNLRRMATGMTGRAKATKPELIAWLRANRPSVEGPACNNFRAGPHYGDICGACRLHVNQHAEGNRGDWE